MPPLAAYRKGSADEGQPVVVVEAMKANELRSPVAGRVKFVHAKPGDKVEAGIAVVEPA